MSILRSFTQNIVVSTLNSTTANLGSGSWWAGTADSNLGAGDIQLLFNSNQNCTIYLDQAGTAPVTGVGTVDTTNLSTTITGHSTFFTRDFHIGDQIWVANGGDTVRVVASVTSDTLMNVTVAFTHTTGAPVTFTQYFWDITFTYNFYSNHQETFSRSPHAQGSYARVRVYNAGSALTTFLRLTTCFTPVMESLPDTTDASGFLPVAIKGMLDPLNYQAYNTPNDELRVAQATRLVGAQMDGSTLDPNFWLATADVGNHGTVTQGSEGIVLTCDTNASASAKLNSIRRARFVGGTCNKFRAHVKLGDTGVANNTKRWGVAYGATMPTITTGAWFQLSGTTFSLVTYKGSSPTTVTNGTFNGNFGSTYSPTTSNTVYEIYMTNSSITFVISGILLHKITNSTATAMDSMSPYIYVDSINSAGTTGSTSISLRSVNIIRLGQLATNPTYKNITGAAATVCKYSGGVIHNLIFNSPTNKAVIIYDNTSAGGTVIATITPANNNIPFDIPFDCPFNNGLTIDTTTGAQNITVVYE